MMWIYTVFDLLIGCIIALNRRFLIEEPIQQHIYIDRLIRCSTYNFRNVYGITFHEYTYTHLYSWTKYPQTV